MPSKKQQTSAKKGKRKKPPGELLIEEDDNVSEAGQNSNSKSRQKISYRQKSEVERNIIEAAA
jgi:hypothetical protein